MIGSSLPDQNVHSIGAEIGAKAVLRAGVLRRHPEAGRAATGRLASFRKRVKETPVKKSGNARKVGNARKKIRKDPLRLGIFPVRQRVYISVRHETTFPTAP